MAEGVNLETFRVLIERANGGLYPLTRTIFTSFDDAFNFAEEKDAQGRDSRIVIQGDGEPYYF